jgi:hypothetical protein
MKHSWRLLLPWLLARKLGGHDECWEMFVNTIRGILQNMQWLSCFLSGYNLQAWDK